MSETKHRQPITERTKWRDDFPVDTPQDDYVSRREFIKFLVLIIGAFMTGQFWIGLLNLQMEPRKPSLKPIASLDQIPVGGHLTFHYPDTHSLCILLRTSEDTLVAYDNKCTHLMCPVIPDMEKGELFCPCHKGFFDINTGRPFAGPPTRKLAEVKLRVEEGMIYAVGMEDAVV